jgi:AraC-like DNA-binding protein
MELAVSKGASQKLLAEQSEINLKDLEDQDKRIPMAKYVALMRAGKALCGDPALALHYGEAIDLSEISIVGLLTHASETMAGALIQINRYGKLVVEVDGIGTDRRFKIWRNREKCGGLWLVDTRTNPNDFPELTESTFARMACRTRQFGNTPFVRAVHVTHPEPSHRAEYDRIFRAPIVFESDRNALLIDESWTNRRIALAPRYVFGIFIEHADALLESLDSGKSTRGQVEALLLPILHTGEARMSLVAGKLALSRRTLFRKLKAEGVTFESVLDALRHRMAQHYLSAKKVSVNETAYLVGFSDPAAFSRAFKRWTGSSPHAMRALCRDGSQSEASRLPSDKPGPTHLSRPATDSEVG